MISDKIVEEIQKYNTSDSMKDLALKILEEDDKGTYNYKKTYDKLIADYIELEGNSNDKD